MIIYHLIDRVPGDRILVMTEGKIVDVLTIEEINKLKTPLPDYVLTYDMSDLFSTTIEGDHKIIWPGGQIEDIESIKNELRENISLDEIHKLATITQDYLRDLPIMEMGDYNNEIAYRVAMSTLDNITESMADGILKNDESTTKSVENEYELLKLVLRMNPHVGDIYKIEKVISVSGSQGDKTVQVFCDPKSLMSIKNSLLRVKTKKKLVGNGDVYIGEYSNPYKFITTSGFEIFRDKEGYHIKSIRFINHKNVNNF